MRLLFSRSSIRACAWRVSSRHPFHAEGPRASSRVNPSPIRSSLQSLLSFFACFEEPRLEQRLPVLCSLLPRAEVRHTCTPSVLCPGRPCCRPLLALLRRPRAALSTPPSPRPSTLAPPDA